MAVVLDRATDRVRSLAARVEAKDPFTEAHTQRVGAAAMRLGARMRLGGDDVDALYVGGIAHDVGKIGVPLEILLKPGPLDKDERATMEMHPVVGEKIVRFMQCGDVLAMVRHHHERYDGLGYPDHLAGERIPLLARIVAVCDAFDALTNDRPYRARRTHEQAAAILRSGAGSQWDPFVVKLFLEGAA